MSSSNLVQFLSSGPVVAMELVGNEAVSVWLKLLGPVDAATAQKEAPQSVRARFATEGAQIVGHGSDSLAAAAKVRRAVQREAQRGLTLGGKLWLSIVHYMWFIMCIMKLLYN